MADGLRIEPKDGPAGAVQSTLFGLDLANGSHVVLHVRGPILFIICSFFHWLVWSVPHHANEASFACCFLPTPTSEAHAPCVRIHLVVSCPVLASAMAVNHTACAQRYACCNHACQMSSLWPDGAGTHCRQPQRQDRGASTMLRFIYHTATQKDYL